MIGPGKIILGTLSFSFVSVLGLYRYQSIVSQGYWE